MSLSAVTGAVTHPARGTCEPGCSLYGVCHCGCGGVTPINRRHSDRYWNRHSGQPMCYLQGHNGKMGGRGGWVMWDSAPLLPFLEVAIRQSTWKPEGTTLHRGMVDLSERIAFEHGGSPDAWARTFYRIRQGHTVNTNTADMICMFLDLLPQGLWPDW